MSQNHGVTKRKRRKVSKTRATKSAKRIATTMAKLKELASAQPASRSESGDRHQLTREEFDRAYPHTLEEAFRCEHPFIIPNGNCKDCGVFVTSVPGLTDRHILVQK